VRHGYAPLRHCTTWILGGNGLKGASRFFVLEGVQQGHRAIETGFNLFCAGGGEVNGSQFPFSEFMVVTLIVTPGNGK